jgi:hypothetical protein
MVHDSLRQYGRAQQRHPRWAHRRPWLQEPDDGVMASREHCGCGFCSLLSWWRRGGRLRPCCGSCDGRLEAPLDSAMAPALRRGRQGQRGKRERDGRASEWKEQGTGSGSAVQNEESKARWRSCDERGQPRGVQFLHGDSHEATAAQFKIYNSTSKTRLNIHLCPFISPNTFSLGTNGSNKCCRAI